MFSPKFGAPELLTMDENTAYCALGRIFGFEPRMAREIAEGLGSASAFFKLSRDERASLLGPFSKYRDIDFSAELAETERDLDAIRKDGCRFIGIADEAFPPALRECGDCPTGLYIRSSSPPEEVFAEGWYIAVVGTRDISPYGEEWCRRIVSALAGCRNKPVIVSGFAIGTDIIAHSTALECGLRTIAVLPTGIDDIYPQRHRSMAGLLARTPGCALVTDYPPRTSPKAINFLRRNRIIAGLSKATILIESKARGGGIITADFAFGYDRDLYALPGRIDDIRSEGCNSLIASGKAGIITGTQSLIRGLGLESQSGERRAGLEERIRRCYSDREDIESILRVAGAVKARRGISPDEICVDTGMRYRDVLRLTGLLESDGFITTDILQRCTVKY